MPLFDWNKSTPACVCGAMVIFRPSEGRLGVMVAGKQELIDSVRACGMVEELLPHNLALQA